MSELAEGVVVVSAAARREQIDRALDEAVDQIFEVAFASRTANRFEETAYIFWRHEALEDARACLAAAKTFRGPKAEFRELGRAMLEVVLAPTLKSIEQESQQTASSDGPSMVSPKMQLARGKTWRARWIKGTGMVGLDIAKSALNEGSSELRELKIEVPLAKWSLVVKNVQSDRKLLGGVLLEFAKHKERVSAAVGNDRLYLELQRVIMDATLALVEAGVLTLTPPKHAAG